MPRTKPTESYPATKLERMIASEKLTIETCVSLDDHTIEFMARGPRRSPREVTVHFNRRGSIICANLHAPEYLLTDAEGGYIRAAYIPAVLQQAAIEAHKEAYRRATTRVPNERR